MGNVVVRRRGPRSYVVEVEGEDHTLGNLIVSKLLELGLADLAYYEMPHPLEDKLIIYVNTREGVDVKEALVKAAEEALRENEEFRRLLLEELKKKSVEVDV